MSIFYYPGAGGSISVTTKPIYFRYDANNLYRYSGDYPLYGNFVTSVSGGGGSYAWQTDYDANIDPYDMGNTWGAPRRSLVGGMYDKSTNNGTRSMHCEAHPYAVASDRTARGCIYIGIILGRRLIVTEIITLIPNSFLLIHMIGGKTLLIILV